MNADSKSKSRYFKSQNSKKLLLIISHKYAIYKNFVFGIPSIKDQLVLNFLAIHKKNEFLFLSR